MTTFHEVASHVKELDRETWLILKNLLIYSYKFERIPLNLLKNKVKLSEKYFYKKILWLHRMGFIEYFKQPYEGARLLTRGLDLIGLKKLSDRDLVSGVGRQIGVGKESDIYEVITPDNEVLSLKVFRLGRVSFTRVRIKRNYINKEYKVPWHLINISAAKKEYENLKYVFRKGVSVPRPVYRVLHMILMERLEGFLLSDVKLDDPLPVYDAILYEIRKAYDADIVNGDLSQFNIFISPEGKIYLIDWPQAEKANTALGRKLLYRDILYISRFFMKKYGLSMEIICNKLKQYEFNKVISCEELEKNIFPL